MGSFDILRQIEKNAERNGRGRAILDPMRKVDRYVQTIARLQMEDVIGFPSRGIDPSRMQLTPIEFLDILLTEESTVIAVEQVELFFAARDAKKVRL